MPDTAQFLKRLHRGGEWAYLWTSEGRRSAWYPVGHPLPTLGRGARNIYFGLHPTMAIPPANTRGEAAKPEAVRSQKAYIAAVNCLFSEFDARPPERGKSVLRAHIAQLDPQPSVIVDSGGGYHCYWLLEEPFRIKSGSDRRRIDALQKGWVSYTGGDGDAKDLTRMLRLPGTRNFKYTPPRPVRWVAHDLGQAYPLPELEAKARPFMPRKRTSRQASAAGRTPTLRDVADAARWLDRLAAWRCDEYEPWVEVGMALSELGTVGLALWDLWSRKSDKYEPSVCTDKWDTFAPGEGLTLASLHYWAEEDDPQPEAEEENVLGSEPLPLCVLPKDELAF
jgi:hypothetical protein